jgi:hypothetical protein
MASECDGNSFDEYNPCPVSVMFAKGEEQAQQEGGGRCLYPHFPDSKRVYFAMEELGDSACTHIKTGWEREICVRKADVPRIMELWYPDGTGTWDYMALINQIEGDLAWIIGFGD